MNVREKRGARAKAEELDREMIEVINDKWRGLKVGLQCRQRSSRYHNTFWLQERAIEWESSFM